MTVMRAVAGPLAAACQLFYKDNGKSAGGPSQEGGFFQRKETEGGTLTRVWFHESE